MVEYTEYIEDSDGTSNNRVDKLFWTKESAEEYIENCNSVDEVRWSDFVEVVCSEEVEV